MVVRLRGMRAAKQRAESEVMSRKWQEPGLFRLAQCLRGSGKGGPVLDRRSQMTTASKGTTHSDCPLRIKSHFFWTKCCGIQKNDYFNVGFKGVCNGDSDDKEDFSPAFNTAVVAATSLFRVISFYTIELR
ncbi:hypothetical protein AVEN_223788-1 [Araneus ventricosus]|uniref:Uncharacterized protein n=1 Tax=Araneus ventricosus TaxID=182803 RepID=A0A4Y2DMK8_ARAVE|nr:hypothetical protein AVEN_223788-1 [Araneus ventricosus]